MSARRTLTGKLSIQDMQKLAKKRGGLCLSKKYIAGRLKLTWQCKKGHIWQATGQSIKHGESWCPKCYGLIHDIKYMKGLAAKRGGKCLSKHFTSVAKKLQWQCNYGHKWRATPASLKRGKWCPQCGHGSFTIEDIQIFAKKHKGLFISTKYKGYREKHRWQCKNGHKFNDTYENIKRRGYFCVKCKQLT